MAYYPSRQQVRRHLDLLKEIEINVSAGEVTYLNAAEGQSIGGARYWVRNLLKSAEMYPDFGFADLASAVIVGLEPGGRVRIVPKAVPSSKAPQVHRFDEMMAISELMGELGSRRELHFWPSPAFDLEGFIDAARENGWEVDVASFDDGHFEANCIRVEEKKVLSPFDYLEGEA